MTTDYRALCAELLSALESEGYAHWVNGPDEDALCLRARAALADEPAVPSALVDTHYEWELEDAEFARAVLARWGNPAPALLSDTHYEWELEDSNGEWQAGGSSNSHSDVEREGIRYLNTFAQDGPHKLIIRQRTTQTINEITYG